MKKFCCVVILSVLFLINCFAKISVNEYVLENGMHLFVMEDFSCATVRVEFASKAGFSSATPNNVGFFPLYTKLFKYSSKENQKVLDLLQVECNADSSRYIATTSVLEFESLMNAISCAAFNPFFSDEDLTRELLSEKKQVSENAISIEGFINSSIDSRIFLDSPWKHDSGIYPNLFAKINNASARLILTSIAEKFYTPKNCALFICGPMQKEYVLQIAEKTFGNKVEKTERIKINDKNAELLKSKTQNKKKYFVLSDSEFSQDMTQIVVQYTNLKMENADFASFIFDQNNSQLKKSILSNSTLKIRAPEYINATSTHKNGSSRLIIQSLMENPKASPYASSMQFVNAIKESVNCISAEDFDNASKKLANSFNASLSSSEKIMELLSEYWALKDYANVQNVFEEELFSQLLKRPELINEQSLENLKENLLQEEPYVFVLVNSKVLEKYKKTFIDNGFEIVTKKNGSWYTQELFKTVKQNLENESLLVEQEYSENQNNFDNSFYVKNNSNIKTYALNNNIPVFIKNRDATNTVCVSLVVKGGQLCDQKNDYGLESVAVECLLLNIQKAIYKMYANKQIMTLPEVYVQHNLYSSCIDVEFVKEDLPKMLEALSNGLIFEELIPSMVDAVVMQEKSNQIVKTSSSVFQLKANAINALFKNKELANAYSSNKDILKNVSFAKVFEKYTKLLNAEKLNIIISGNINFDSEVLEKSELKIIELLNEYFGILNNENLAEKIQLEKNNFPKKTKKVKITHLFMTDVSREKAGPRPQVLIPTTEFLDPAQYWINFENVQIEKTLLNAILLDFTNELNKKCEQVEQVQKMIVMCDVATDVIPYGAITFLNVKNISLIESIYQEVLSDYFENLTQEKIQQIKSYWIKNQLSKTQTNSGMCELIYKGLDLQNQNPLSYIEEYSKLISANADDFTNGYDCFELDNLFKLYSADTKK